MHYYQFNIGDYASHTNHLDPIEDVAYRRMIDWCYLHEEELPKDIEEIAREIRMRDHCKCIAYVLQKFFEESETGYFQPRIRSEVKEFRKLSAKRKKAANARWASKHKGLDSDASALQVESKSNAKQEPETRNQKPIKHIRQPKPDDTPYQAIIDLYHEALPELPAVKALNAKRKQAIKARWNSEDKTKNLDYWKGYFQHVRRSNFLMGSTGWMANIDFLFTESKYIKIIEGGYEEGARQ